MRLNRLLAAFLVAPLMLTGCRDGDAAGRELNGWECVQTARDQAELAQALAEPARLGAAAAIAESLRGLRVPGLQPASFLDAVLQRPLPYAAMSQSQRDTFMAWLEFGAPPDVRLARNAVDVGDFTGALLEACRREPLPMRPVWGGTPERWDVVGRDPGELGFFGGRRDGQSALAAAATADGIARGEDAAGAAAILFGDRFARDLLASAASAPSSESYDGDGDGLTGSIAGSSAAAGVRLSARQIANILLAASRDEPSLDHLLSGVARAEAAVVRAGVERAQASNRSGDQIGAFAGIFEAVVFATGSEELAGKGLALHDAVIDELAGRHKSAARLIRRAKPVSLDELRSRLPDAVDAVAGAAYVDSGGLGSVQDVVDSIVAATGGTGRVFPKAFIDRQGRVKSLGSMPELSRLAFSHWISTLPLPPGAAGAKEALEWRFAGCCPNRG